MKQILNAVAMSAFFTLFSPTISAAPAATYTFNVTSYNCFLADCQDEIFFRNKLESMELDVTQQALDNGEATLHYKTLDWSADNQPANIVASENQGFHSTNFSAWNVDLDMNQGLCKSYYLCDVKANFEVAEFLTGSFLLNTNNDNVHMSSLNASTWSGYIYSDGPYMTYSPNRFPTFTGEWRLQRAVSEPGGLALFLTALTGVGLFLRRKPA